MWRQHLTEADRRALGPIDGYADATWRCHRQAALDLLATLASPPPETIEATVRSLGEQDRPDRQPEEVAAIFDAVILAVVEAEVGRHEEG